MPGKMARSAPRPPFGLPDAPVAVRTSRLSCGKAGKARIFTPVWDSSGEFRLTIAPHCFRCDDPSPCEKILAHDPSFYFGLVGPLGKKFVRQFPTPLGSGYRDNVSHRRVSAIRGGAENLCSLRGLPLWTQSGRRLCIAAFERMLISAEGEEHRGLPRPAAKCQTSPRTDRRQFDIVPSSPPYSIGMREGVFPPFL
jgi:hypothetical protein